MIPADTNPLSASHSLREPIARWTGRFPALLLLLTIGGAPGCSESAGGAESDAGAVEPPRGDISEVVRPVERIRLEESDAVINVAPRVSVDPEGGFVIADPKEYQVRLYGPDGRLRDYFGRRGAGPGEFQLPMSARRLADGRIFVGDFVPPRVSLFDAAGDSVLETDDVQLYPLYGAVQLDRQRLLLMGRGRESRPPFLLHEWDLEESRVVGRFFPTPVSEKLQTVSMSMGWVDADLRGDSLAVVYSLSDTLYVFHPDSDDRPDEKLPLPIAGYSLTPPTPEAMSDAKERTAWLETIVTVSDLHWLEDGSFLVQYGRRDGTERKHGLLLLDRRGRERWELFETPRLLATGGDTLYFVDPQSMTPNRWLVARLRGS